MPSRRRLELGDEPDQNDFVINEDAIKIIGNAIAKKNVTEHENYLTWHELCELLNLPYNIQNYGKSGDLESIKNFLSSAFSKTNKPVHPTEETTDSLIWTGKNFQITVTNKSGTYAVHWYMERIGNMQQQANLQQEYLDGFEPNPNYYSQE